MHKHHIVPQHMGGSDDPSNLIEVTVEQHAELHFALYLEHGLLEDWRAFHFLKSIIGKEEEIKQIQSRPKTEEHKKKISEATKGVKKKQNLVACPYCGEMHRPSNLQRHINAVHLGIKNKRAKNSADFSKKQSERMKNLQHKECDICGQMVHPSNFKRHRGSAKCLAKAKQ